MIGGQHFAPFGGNCQYTGMVYAGLWMWQHHRYQICSTQDAQLVDAGFIVDSDRQAGLGYLPQIFVWHGYLPTKVSEHVILHVAPEGPCRKLPYRAFAS